MESIRVRLTPREMDVFESVQERLTNKEIADRLSITVRTAKFHVSNLLEKFNVESRTDLMLLKYHPMEVTVYDSHHIADRITVHFRQ